MEERRDYTVFWVLMLALLLLTRIPASAAYLSIDNVNLAFSLEKFDPRIHQPQPPGYPFFVGFARIVNVFFRDAERTFLAISLIVSGLCLPLAFAIGRRMFSPWAGAAGVFLLLVNPVFWFGGIDGPLRPFLALFSLLTAYCCWRCWNGEKRFAVWGAIALAVGAGFRPELIAFLFPIWLISAWVGTKSVRAVAASGAVLGAIVLVWVGAIVISMGGLDSFTKIMRDYAVAQSPESMVFGNPVVAWLRQINRLVIWNSLTIATWMWALPAFLRNRDRLGLRSSQSAFFFIWVVPGLIVQALVHIASPGHALASVAALCVLGGYVVSLVRERETFLASALVLNAMLFLGFFALPAGLVDSPNRTPSLKNAMLFGTAETSLGQLRSVDDIYRTTLKEIRDFTPAGRPSIIIATDTYNERYFMNWRIVRYYLPERDIWTLYKRGSQYGMEHIRREKYFEKLESTSMKISIPTDCRILWVLEPQGELHKKLAADYRLAGGRWVFYTDLAGDTPAIKLDGVEILPSPFGSSPGQTVQCNYS